jgi:hypothetical protein
MDLRQVSSEDVFKIKQRLLELLQGDESLYYLCYSCQESRQVDVICDVHCENFSSESNLDEEIDL